VSSFPSQCWSALTRSSSEQGSDAQPRFDMTLYSVAALAVLAPVMSVPMGVTKEAGVELNHLVVLRTEEATR